MKIRGRYVPPKKISVGERNVLGLCYFFAKLFSNKKKEDRYKEEGCMLKSAFSFGFVASATYCLGTKNIH